MVAPTQQNAIVPAQDAPEALAVYIRRPEIMEKFALVMKDYEARRFVQNVIVLYETAEPGDYSLQNCSPRSIVRAALRAATQKVSVDPAEREAYLIPRKVNRKDKNGAKVPVLEACFSFHYQEIENRAWRTNRYTHINVSPIYEGTEIKVNIFTGLHSITVNGLEINTQSASVSANWGKADGLKRIGWLGYYRTNRGREMTIYMTVEEIEAQVSSGNPYWSSSFGWKKFREIMERKTVLLALLRRADLKAPEMMAVKEALDVIDEAENIDDEAPIEEKIIEGETRAAEQEAQPAKRTEEQTFEDLFGKDPQPAKAAQPETKAYVQRGPGPVIQSAATTTPAVEKADAMKKFSAAWKKAQEAGLGTDDNKNIWRVTGASTTEEIIDKTAMIDSAITLSLPADDNE